MEGKVYLVTSSHQVAQNSGETIQLSRRHIKIDQVLTDTVTAYIEGISHLPFLLSKEVLTKIQEQQNYNFKTMEVRKYNAVLQMIDGPEKRIPMIDTAGYPDDLVIEDAKKKIKQFHGYDIDVDYSRIDIEWTGVDTFVNTISKEEPKQVEPTLEVDADPIEESVIEEAVVLSETANEPTEDVIEHVDIEEVPQEETKVLPDLPAVPDKFFIKGDKDDAPREYSLAKVAEKKQQADELIKVFTEDKYEDKKIRKQINDLRLSMVKERTNPSNYFKKNIDGPVKKFLKEMKEGLEQIGDAASLVENSLEKALKDADEFLIKKAEEKERKETELANTRVAALQALGGIYDPVSKSVSHETLGLVLDIQLRDEGYDFTSKESEYQKEFEKAQEQKKAEASRLSEMEEMLLEYRTKDMESAGYTLVDGVFQNKELGDVSTKSVAKMSKDDFKSLLERKPSPPEEVKEQQPASKSPIEITSYPTPKANVVEVDIKPPKEVTLDFSEHGFIDVMLKGAFLRIYPFGTDDVALASIDPDDVLTPSYRKDLGLTFVPIKNKR